MFHHLYFYNKTSGGRHVYISIIWSRICGENNLNVIFPARLIRENLTTLLLWRSSTSTSTSNASKWFSLAWSLPRVKIKSSISKLPQVLRGHHGDIGRVPNSSKAWSWPQTEVARHVCLPSTSLLLLRRSVPRPPQMWLQRQRNLYLIYSSWEPRRSQGNEETK